MEGIVREKTSYSTKGVLCLVLKWFIILLFAVCTLFPLLWLSITSLKTNVEYFNDPFSFPAVPQFQNCISAFSQADLEQMIWNSATVAVVAAMANMFVTAMVSYAISCFDFKGKGIFFTIFSVGVVVPLSALMVPCFAIFSRISLLGSMNALRVLYTTIGLLIAATIIRGFMDSLPYGVEETAYIDGCEFFGRFFQIILPLSKTELITAATSQFITYWNRFVYANLLTLSPQDKTVQIGIRYFTNQLTMNYVPMYVTIIIVIVPSVLGYALLRRQIISGMTSDTVKS